MPHCWLACLYCRPMAVVNRKSSFQAQYHLLPSARKTFRRVQTSHTATLTSEKCNVIDLITGCDPNSSRGQLISACYLMKSFGLILSQNDDVNSNPLLKLSL